MKRSFLCTILLFTLMSLCVQANEVDQLKKKVDPYLTHVAQQSDWLYSRLQMYWKTHATDVFCNGETYDHVGGKRAPEPTVKMNGTRSTKSDYNRPRIEDIVPYDDDDEGSVTFVNATTGKMEKTSPNKTGCNIAALNNQILSIARDLALVSAHRRPPLCRPGSARGARFSRWYLLPKCRYRHQSWPYADTLWHDHF